MIVEGRNISGAPTLMPLIICSSLPSWLEWNTLISTFPLSAALTRLAYSSVVIANREPGKPTWPRRSVMVCATDPRTQTVITLTTRTARNVRFMSFSPFPSCRAAWLQISRSALSVFHARLVQDAFSPAEVEYAAAAEARHRARDRGGTAPVLLDPVDHLFCKMRRNHAVPAHRRKLEHGCIRQFVHPPAK